MKNTVRNLFSVLIQRGAISSASLVGCTSEEVAIVRDHFGGALPSAYIEFLEISGKGAGKLFQGTDIFYPRVLQLQSEAVDLLVELNQSELLPINAKVFCMHQGYELNYFTPTTDDPPVFQFFEGQSAPTQPWPRFSEFLDASIKRHLEQWQS